MEGAKLSIIKRDQEWYKQSVGSFYQIATVGRYHNWKKKKILGNRKVWQQQQWLHLHSSQSQNLLPSHNIQYCLMEKLSIMDTIFLSPTKSFYIKCQRIRRMTQRSTILLALTMSCILELQIKSKILTVFFSQRVSNRS